MDSGRDTHRWVGCPIRISTDQSLLAAPHGFSQRATSFIASWCQGIHRMPFSRSIAPHAQKPATARAMNRSPANKTIIRARTTTLSIHTHASGPRARNAPTSSLVQRTPGSPDGQNSTDASRLVPSQDTRSDTPRDDASAPRPWRPWWRRTGSNRRPPACKAGALPAELRPHTNGSIALQGNTAPGGPDPTSRFAAACIWWAREDLNLRPHAYQACALTN